MLGIVNGVVQSAAFLALQRLPRDEVTNVNHVPQFADVLRGLHTLEEVFRLFVEQVEAFPGTMKPKVAADDSHVGGHDLVHFLHVLRDEHLLFIRHRSLVVPFRDTFVEVVRIDDFQRVTGSGVGIDHGFDERIAGQTIASMQSGARTFAHRIEPLDAALPVEVHLDAATHIVRTGCHRDVLLGDVDADAQALGIDVGEMMLCFLGVFVRDVKADMVQAVDFHLAVYGACHDVARCQTQPLVVFLHEFLAVGKPEDTAIASHRLGDEVGRMGLFGIEQYSRMELHELHVLYLAFGTIDHCYAVARRDVRIRRRCIDGTRSARCHEGDFAEIGVHLSCFGIEDVSAIALDVGRSACDANAEMMLCDYFYSKVILQHFDVGIAANCFHEAALNLRSCVVGVVENAEL